ncbi:MAG: HEAT repeat domain-containing protein [Spirochaetales bacterium]|nr:HEAT repeat domain-containing protein [Spirochaetales bacterium]
MKKLILILLSLFFISSFLISEEEKEEEEIISLRMERLDMLKYGIDSEVTELLTTLNSEEDDEFNDVILQQIKISSNSDMINGALQLFITTEYREAEDFAIDILKNDDLYSNSILSKVMFYLSKDLSKDGAEAVALMFDHDQASVARSAIAAIGHIEDENYAEQLLELLDDDDFHEEVKSTILVSLGDMKAMSAIDLLTDIALDENEEKSWRWYACQSLGKIGAVESFPVLKSLLGDDDPNLRSFAVEGIGYFDSDETGGILISALRDSFWKVRVSAARQLGELKESNAVGILIYKAGKDPENNVKKEAIKALGLIGDEEGFDYLKELVGSTRTNPAIWTSAVDCLMDNNLQDSMEVFTKMIEDEWEKDNSFHLEYLAKSLSIQEGGFLQSLTGRFMDHSSLNLKIYGLRMAEKNGFNSYKERIEVLSGEDSPNAVRKTALSALESF